MKHAAKKCWVRTVASLALSLGLLPAQSGFFGGGGGYIVYDPTNHAETAVTAANSIRQTAQMVQAYTLQMQQYLTQLQNLKQLPQAVIQQILQPYTEQVATAQALSQALNATLGQVNNLQATFNAQFRQMAAMGVGPTEYMNREMQIAQYRGESIATVFKGEIAAMQSVNDSYSRIRKLQEQIPASAGMQQSFQTVNQHLSLLAGQNAQLIALIASHQANASARAQDESSANALAGEIIQKRRQDDAGKVKQLHQQLHDLDATMGWGLMSQGQ
jgi:P-type conjugative transfer protein TrbJ